MRGGLQAALFSHSLFLFGGLSIAKLPAVITHSGVVSFFSKAALTAVYPPYGHKFFGRG
jgi:hypothetical protein